MNNPLGVSPSKGNQGTTRGKEKIIFNSVGIEHSYVPLLSLAFAAIHHLNRPRLSLSDLVAQSAE